MGKQRGLKSTDLGPATGLSHSFLSHVESSQTYPSATALRNIADALDTTPAELLSGTAASEPFLVRDGEGRIFPTAEEHPDRVVRPLSKVRTIAVNGRYDTTPTMSHDSEAFIYIVEGALGITVDETTYTLDTADSLVFDS